MLTAPSGQACPALISPSGTLKKRNISRQATPCGPAGWLEQEVHTSPVQGGARGSAASAPGLLGVEESLHPSDEGSGPSRTWGCW